MQRTEMPVYYREIQSFDGSQIFRRDYFDTDTNKSHAIAYEATKSGEPEKQSLGEFEKRHCLNGAVRDDSMVTDLILTHGPCQANKISTLIK